MTFKLINNNNNNILSITIQKQDAADQGMSTILQKTSLESRIEAMLPAKENAERVMKKADLLRKLNRAKSTGPLTTETQCIIWLPVLYTVPKFREGDTSGR